MNTKIEQASRLQIAEFLPDAIASALMSYQSFLEEEATKTENTKTSAFKAHHDACKVAIAHIQLLLKLAEWADLPDSGAEDQNNQQVLRGLIENAKAELGEGSDDE